jgi:hypothetical protein
VLASPAADGRGSTADTRRLDEARASGRGAATPGGLRPIVGALLTIVGGLFVNARQRRGERRDVVGTKLEELYLLSGTLVKWAQGTHSQAVGIALKSSVQFDVPEAPIDEMVMRAKFYEPRLRGRVEDLAARAEDVWTAAKSTNTSVPCHDVGRSRRANSATT